jgi:outer membrane protein assembly factor BamB
VVWGDRVFVTTAVRDNPPRLALGDTGGIDLADDRVPHTWRLVCLSAKQGTVLWSADVHSGLPRAKRHVKSSQANATPATDGRFVVAILGSEGLFAFDMEGTLRWRADLGVLNPGLLDDASSSSWPAATGAGRCSLSGRVATAISRCRRTRSPGLFSPGGPKQRLYRERTQATHSASLVASDGRLYAAAEGGEVIVLKAGRTFEVLARNDMGETLMATPAISGGTLFIRGAGHVYAIGKPPAPAARPVAETRSSR